MDAPLIAIIVQPTQVNATFVLQDTMLTTLLCYAIYKLIIAIKAVGVDFVQMEHINRLLICKQILLSCVLQTNNFIKSFPINPLLFNLQDKA
jgi:hypothetical protein